MEPASIMDGYAADATELVPQFEALGTAQVLLPICDLLPASRSRVLDVGAGTGRDAAWFARRGHEATALEPVAPLRRAGMELHSDLDIRWLDDHLPELSSVTAAGREFDLILLIGVWQHLTTEEQPEAMQALAQLLAPSGRLIISARHGPGALNRPCFPADVPSMIHKAQELGLTLIARRRAPSIQQKNRDAGVEWTWLCWERRSPE